MSNQVTTYENLFRANEIVRKNLAPHDMTADEFGTLVLIAAKPGITQAEIGSKMDLQLATVRRNVRVLSKKMVKGSKGRWVQKGCDLVVVSTDESNPGMHTCRLTAEGEKFLSNFTTALEGGDRR